MHGRARDRASGEAKRADSNLRSRRASTPTTSSHNVPGHPRQIRIAPNGTPRIGPYRANIGPAERERNGVQGLLDWLQFSAYYLTFWHGLMLGIGLGLCLAAYAELVGNARARRRQR